MSERTPAGLRAPGKRLWKALIEEFELVEHEQLVLLEACRTVDRLDALAKGHKGEPLTVVNHRGDEVAHPMLVEARQQSITLTRLIASLRIPDAEDHVPQRRGPRGAYQPRAVS